MGLRYNRNVAERLSEFPLVAEIRELNKRVLQMTSLWHN